MAHKVFIDGEAGTTGLQIRDRLAPRRDIELVQLDPARRKDPLARHDALAEADIAILCLPTPPRAKRSNWPRGCRCGSSTPRPRIGWRRAGCSVSPN